MNFFDPYLIAISIFSLGIGIALIIATRNIQYNGVGTDNQIMAKIASGARFTKWPSQIHREEFKSLMKDTTILLIAVFQRLLRNTKNDHPYIVVNTCSNMVSAILIYFIAKQYFSAPIAFFASALFLSYLFAWVAVIQVGHTTVANVFFLLSVYLMLHAFANPLLFITAAGAAFALCMFSSPSARKYILLFFAALFFAKYKSALYDGQYLLVLKNFWTGNMLAINVCLVFSLLSAIFILKFGYKKVVTNMYYQRSFPWLNKIIVSRDKFSLEHYLEHAENKVRALVKKIIDYGIVIILALNLVGIDYLSAALFGFALIVIFLMAPEFKKNIGGYIYYAVEAGVKNRYRVYPIMFAKAGKPLPFPVERPGVKWIIRFFLKTAPFQTYAYAFAIIYIIISSLNSTKPLEQILIACAVLVISLLPIIYGELTRAVQVGRAYLPCFVGGLIFISYAFEKLYEYHHYYFWIISFPILFGAFLFGIWKFTRDVFPVRMCSARIIKKLDEFGIKEFSTYHIAYNNVLINNIDPEILSRYTIKRINNLQEVKDGWIIIPGTSSKALNMESEFEEILQGDFLRDPLLNKLLETRDIEKIAESKFQTPGTSDIWVHESEITSYRDLIIHDISEKDRFRGYAWILHSNKIQNLN